MVISLGESNKSDQLICAINQLLWGIKREHEIVKKSRKQISRHLGLDSGVRFFCFKLKNVLHIV